MSTSKFGIIVEDDDTNTIFQFEKKLDRMKGSLRSMHDGRIFLLRSKKTFMGRENCDINILGVQVENKHAVIEYDEKKNCFTIKDLSTSHGTYVNDVRILTTGTRLAHGDIIRIGHGGPRFDVLLNIQNNPPVIMQQAWDGANYVTHSNLPYIPLQTSTTSEMLQSNIPYSRQNGYVQHKIDLNSIPMNIPHPPTRSRPVSANPSNGIFLPSNSQIMNNSLIKDFSNLQNSALKTSDQVMDLESRLLKMGDEIARLATYETECFQKDGIIASLRNDLEQSHKQFGDRNYTLLEENKNRLSSLQYQISYKDEEINRLQDIIRQTKNEKVDGANRSTDKIAEMKTLLARYEQNNSIMETEIRKANQEKSQLSTLVNTLQKEVSAKDVLLRKSKSETEKWRLEMRKKDAEISSLATKIGSHTALKQAEKDLKNREDEIGNLRYRLRVAEEKLNKKSTSLRELQDSLSESNYSISETEKSNNSLQQELSYTKSKCSKVEHEYQSLQIEFQNLQRKYEKFHQSVAEFWGKEGRKISSVLDDDDVLSYIHELKDERDNAHNRLEDALMEKIELEKQVCSTSIQDTRNFLREVERRFQENGRSCRQIDNELKYFHNFEIPDEFCWIKDFVLSILSQEYEWEQHIEDALVSMMEESEKDYLDPALLIKRLQEKLKINLEKIHDLETRYDFPSNPYSSSYRRITDGEHKHTKLCKELKDQMKEKYKKKTEKALRELKEEHEIELQNLLEEAQRKLSSALDIQKQMYEKDMGSVAVLSQKIESLKIDHRKAHSEFKKLQKELDGSRKTEVSLKQKIKEQDLAYEIKEEILEKKLREKDEQQFKDYQEQLRDSSLTISSLEKTIINLNNEKNQLEDELIDSHQSLKEEKLEKKKFKKEESKSNHKLNTEMEKLNMLIKSLREQVKKTENERDEEKKIGQSLRHDLDGLTTRLTDLKGELNDKEKEKVESLEEKTKSQEKEICEQRKQLLQLSNLVEEQKEKLIEQDQKLTVQNNTLAYQADGLREILNEEKLLEKKKVKFDKVLPPTQLICIGEECLHKRHEHVIAKQRAALSDLRASIDKMEHPPLPNPSNELVLREISSIKKENISLREQLSVKNGVITDEELHKELLHTKEMLVASIQDYQVEKNAHRITQDALHDSEEIYLRLVRSVSSELDINHVFGCKPIGFVEYEGRDTIIKDRAKAFDIIMKRINQLQTRITKKDQLLEHYDGDLKILRETEDYAGKKTAEVKRLENEVTRHQDEICYLREALKKCRDELDKQTRLNIAYKQRKIFLMDYKEESPPKKHNCYLDEQKQYKAEQKLKTKNEMLKKQKYEIDGLQNELFKTETELKKANAKLTELSIVKSVTNDDDLIVDEEFLE